MPKYHLTETGPKACTASKRPCRYGVSEESHYTDKKEAAAAYERKLSEENSLLPTTSKKIDSTESVKKHRVLSKKELSILKSKFPKVKNLTNEEGKELTVKMAEERKELEEILTEDENFALDIYTVSAYSNINSYLRTGKFKDEDKYYDMTDPYDVESRNKKLQRVQQEVSDIDSAMKKATKAEPPRTLYRYQKVETEDTVSDYAKLEFTPGSVLTEKGFHSTTEDPALVHGYTSFYNKDKYVVYQIVSKDGISLQKRDYEDSGHVQSMEKERLLPRGKEYRVVGVKRERFDTPKERVAYQMKYERNNSMYGDVYRTLKPKSLTVVMLLDEELLEEYLEQD